MNVFDGWSDDQVAIVGCAIAFFATMGVMVFTHSIRQWRNGSAKPDPMTIPVDERRVTEIESSRKAA